jgi:hypothetical protein
VTARKLTRTQVGPAREILLKQQGYKCALCECDFREQTIKGRKRVQKYKPALDHCHTTGYVRAVLCVNCNGREGEIWNRAQRCKRAGTSVTWLQRLVDYWTLHATPQTVYIHPDHKSDDDKRLAKNAAERKKRAQAKAVAILGRKK